MHTANIRRNLPDSLALHSDSSGSATIYRKKVFLSSSIRIVFQLVLAGSLCSGQKPMTDQGQLDGNPALFSVLAALDAAGYGADIDSCFNHPLRKLVRDTILAKNLPSVFELKRYIRDHSQGGDAGIIGLYVSFALVVDGPPNFKYRLRSNDLPPEVATLTGFQELMQTFHKEAGMDELWKRSQPAIEQMLSAYHEQVSRAVLESNGYVRSVTSGYKGRRFQIYLDPLGPPNQVHTRSYGDEFFVVITPSPEPQVDEIRHRYLQYLIDPLTLRFAENIEKKKALIDFAQASPLLAGIYKADFSLLVQRSLVKAIEARMISGPGAIQRRQQLVDTALAEGFILTPHFAEALVQYEKQETALRLYLPEMIDAINLKKEDKRLEGVQFASVATSRKPKAVCKQEEEAPKVIGGDKLLEDAETAINARPRRLEDARKLLLSVLQDTDDKGRHTKAYYGLARIATLEKDPELAERLFRKTLEMAPDPFVKAWSLVYLGNLNDLSGQQQQAAENYKAALAVEGGSERAREQAQKGLSGAFQRKAQ